MHKAEPLRSTKITPLQRYYGLLRLPPFPIYGYVFPFTVGVITPDTTGLSGS
jgi:hypothetical protein